MKPIALFTLLCLAGCAAHKITLGSTYIGANKQHQLRLSDNDFTLRGITRFIDTLSYGKWKQEGNMIVLHSDEKFSHFIFETDVQESATGSKDSIYIEIENDLGGWTYAGGLYIPHIYFRATAQHLNGQATTTEQFDKKHVFKTVSPLKEFNLSIMPNLFTYDREKTSGIAFITYRYKVKSQENNTFKVTIRNIDTHYFSHVPLNGEYIKIINSDTLLWDDEFYVKSPKVSKPLSN